MTRYVWVLLGGCNAIAPAGPLDESSTAEQEQEPVQEPEPEPVEEEPEPVPEPEPVEPEPAESLTPCWDAYEAYEAGEYEECRYLCLVDHGEVRTQERVACDDGCNAGLEDAQREYERCTSPPELLAYDECLAEVARQWDFWQRCTSKCGERTSCAQQFIEARAEVAFETYACEYFYDYAYLLTFVCADQYEYGEAIENARKWQAYYECRIEYVYELGLDGANCKKPE